MPVFDRGAAIHLESRLRSNLFYEVAFRKTSFVGAGGILGALFLDTVVRSKVEARLLGVKIKVPDIREAKKFYLGTLGFAVKNENKARKTVSLKTNSYQVVLEESASAKRISVPGYSDVSMSMQVNDIDETFRKLKAAKVRFIKDEAQRGDRLVAQILDPFGNKISMMQVTAGKPETIAEPSVYNCGLYVTDIEKELSTYEGIFGFAVRSRAYMPEDMPLGTSDGKFAFMLHLRRSDFAYVRNPNMYLMLQVASAGDIDQFQPRA